MHVPMYLHPVSLALQLPARQCVPFISQNFGELAGKRGFMSEYIGMQFIPDEDAVYQTSSVLKSIAGAPSNYSN